MLLHLWKHASKAQNYIRFRCNMWRTQTHPAIEHADQSILGCACIRSKIKLKMFCGECMTTTLLLLTHATNTIQFTLCARSRSTPIGQCRLIALSSGCIQPRKIAVASIRQTDGASVREWDKKNCAESTWKKLKLCWPPAHSPAYATWD